MMAAEAVGSPLSLSAAFLVGMAGSMHCLAMCGGISGALGMRARRVSPPRRVSSVAVMHQIGRLTSYALAGGIVGACSGLLQSLADINQMAVVARILAGLVLLAIGTNVLFNWKSFIALERVGGRLWGRLAPLARHVPADGVRGALLLGMLWGWLPCGFVYSVLMFAALQGGALSGAAMMLFFGLGTLPALLGAGLLGSKLGIAENARKFQTVSGWLLLAFGTLSILGPLSHAHH